MKDEKDIIGIQKIDFKPENSDNRIQGYKFYFLEESHDPNFIGKRCMSYWVSESLKGNQSFTCGKWEFDISIWSNKVRINGLKKIS